VLCWWPAGSCQPAGSHADDVTAAVGSGLTSSCLLSVDKLNLSLDLDPFRGEAVLLRILVVSGPQVRRKSRLSFRTIASRRGTYFPPQSNDLFRQPAASRIDDVSLPFAGMKPNTQIGSAWKKQVAWPVRLSQENRGFGPYDSKRCNPGSGDASEPRLGRSGDREVLFDSSRSNVPQLRSAKGLQGLCVWVSCHWLSAAQ